MHIAVMGAGSMGLLLAAKLSAVAESMEVITRTEEQAAAIRNEGISIEGGPTVPGNKFEVFSYLQKPNFLESAAELNYLLLTVKQSAIDEELLKFIMHRISPHTTVVCFQNGIGHEEKLLHHLDKSRLLLAISTEGARKQGPSVVAHAGRGVTDLGYSYPLQNDEYPNPQKNFAAIMKSAGFEVSLSKNMDTKVWSKLIINSIINPLTAVLQVQNGELLRSSSSQAIMRALYNEAVMLAKSTEVVVPEHLWETVLQVCERTANNHSSMLQDIIHSRKTEIDSINGSLLRIAKKMNLELPVHQTVYHMVKALENK